MWYLMITVFFYGLNGEVNIYVDDFRSKQYCEQARVKFIEAHEEEAKSMETELRNVECVRIDKR